jgi:inosine triphosphate pyrophosphatase
MQSMDFSHITFVTGNIDKAKEVQELLPGLTIVDVDMPEIQELNSKKIIAAKIQSAFDCADIKGPIIVDDTGFYLDCWDGQLPGPLVKWFLQSIKDTGLATIAERLGNTRATAKTMIGYASDRHTILFFEGSMAGRVVQPTGQPHESRWSAIFIPDGYEQIYHTMPIAAKNAMSMRAQAIKKLREFLLKERA